MGVVVITAYRPKPGMSEPLREIVIQHLPILREAGLATDRTEVILEATDGTILEVFEWTSTDAIRTAHEHPKVLEMWSEFDRTCDHIRLTDLPETHELFASFRPLN